MNSRTKTAAVIAAVIVGAATSNTAARAQAAAPTDPQIVGIVIAANQIDIDHGNMALAKSKDKQVRAFAQQMVTDHSAVQKSVLDLGAKLKVTPEDSPTSESLKAQSAQTLEKLKGLSGKKFDDAYVDSEIAYHKQVIDALTNVLIPNAQNPELKAALTGAKPLFVGHLEHAENVQASLKQNNQADSQHSHRR